MPDEQPILSLRHERFCQEFLVDYNATQAAIRVGYSSRTARQQASRLMARADIRAYIQAREQELWDQLGVNRYRTVRALCNIVFYDIRAIFDDQNRFRDFCDLPLEALCAIRSFVVLRRGDRKDSSGQPVRDEVIGVILCDQLKALKLLMQFQGLLRGETQKRTWVNLGAALRKARQRENIIR